MNFISIFHFQTPKVFHYIQKVKVIYLIYYTQCVLVDFF